MAERTPIIGGKPDAPAIPKLRGSASKKTIKPDVKSDEKFCLSPSSQSLGTSWVLVFDCVLFELITLLLIEKIEQAHEAAHSAASAWLTLFSEKRSGYEISKGF